MIFLPSNWSKLVKAWLLTFAWKDALVVIFLGFCPSSFSFISFPHTHPNAQMLWCAGDLHAIHWQGLQNISIISIGNRRPWNWKISSWNVNGIKAWMVRQQSSIIIFCFPRDYGIYSAFTDPVFMFSLFLSEKGLQLVYQERITRCVLHSRDQVLQEWNPQGTV